MRIVQKLLYGIGGLLALILLLVAICHYNPGLASKLGSGLQADSGGSTPSTVSATGVHPTGTGSGESASTGGASAQGLPSDRTDAMAALSMMGMGPNPRLISTTTTTDALPTAQAAEDEDTLEIPSKVAGLNGYVPIKATGTEITQKQADELISTLSKGRTGERLTFDERIYPYYHMLNDTQQALYKQIYANADALIDDFSPVKSIVSNDLKNAFTAVVNDHPELFWVNTAYRYKYAPLGEIAEIKLSFNATANDLDKAKSEFEAAAKLITDSTYGLYTDYEKEKKVHDELIKQVKYDANAPMNQSAYSALVYGRTVCAGYARAYQYVMQQLDIPCYYVTGYAGENHAWNIVKLDDGYYNVDTTWDDTNPNTYDYFNCSDADYAGNHVRRDLSVYLPPCNGNKYSGLEVNPTTPAASTTTTPATTTTTTPATTPATTTTTTPATPSTTTGGERITVQTVRGDDERYLYKLEDYYLACFEAMMATDANTISFDVIAMDEQMWDDVYNAYAYGDVQDGFIERYLVEKHKTVCNISVEAQPRSDGSYLLHHTAYIQ
ncbi:MAG: hypothetical protein NC337_08505 [Roseburia sp.]|nr:hypothetical protein [Roseburia sp.]